MRMTSERKAETRERILAAAGALFRGHGIDAVGVDAIMHQAGLTHGGFYAHFASKEALVAEVSAAALARSAARWERISQEADPATALARIVRELPRSGACCRGRAWLRPGHAGPRDGAAARRAAGDHRVDPAHARCAGALPAGAATRSRAGDAVSHGWRSRAGAVVRRSAVDRRISWRGARGGGASVSRSAQKLIIE